VNEKLILAVDGGGSKTDLALARGDGSLLSLVRGPISSPQVLDLERCLETLAVLVERAYLGAGLLPASAAVAEVAQILLSGLDYPAEEKRLLELASGRGWAAKTFVGNDTFAVLRAGSESGWGVAVVCGTGVNCVGVAPDGRQVRFASQGETSGDWGGGYDVGLAALAAAVRSEDGRGPATTLEGKVPALFGLERPLELTEAIHLGEIAIERVSELAPVVLDEAQSDPVAAAIVDRLASEIVAFARAALVRLELTNEPARVLLGGGLLQAGNARLLEGIEAGLREVGPKITVHVNASPPIVGAALLALDELGSSAEAKERLRGEIVAAVERL
jgi:N-acetylglucosamine kinase-like BadF-type ATPase